MKTKIVNNKPSTNNTKSQSKAENQKKNIMLTEKLANHFKLRLVSLISEKNYKYSNMIIDIGSFLRKLENTNIESESVIPKMEKFLLEILSKLPSDNSKYLTDMGKINKILKTENFLAENNTNTYLGLQGINSPGVISSKNKLNVNNLYNSNASNNNVLLTENYLKTMPNESANILANKPGAYLAVNPLFSSKSELTKNKNVSKTNSKKNILKINTNQNSNNIKNNNLNNINKNEKLNNLVTDHSSDKNVLLNSHNTNVNLTNPKSNEYTGNNTVENLYLNEVYNTTDNNRSTSTKLNILNNNKNNYNNVNLVQKQDKLNNLKEKALDEWAMIVKYNHLKHLEEEQNNKKKDEDKKKLVKEILENQMKEKDQMKKMKQEEDKKFFKMQTDKIENSEKEYFEKERLRVEKIKNQKETQEKLIKGKFLFFKILIIII